MTGKKGKRIGFFVSFTINNGCSIFFDNPEESLLVDADRLIRGIDFASEIVSLIVGIKKTVEDAGFETAIEFSTYPRGEFFKDGEKSSKKLVSRSTLLIGGDGEISYNGDVLFQVQNNKLGSAGQLVLFIVGVRSVIKEVNVEFDKSIKGTGIELAKNLLTRLSK